MSLSFLPLGDNESSNVKCLSMVFVDLLLIEAKILLIIL